MLHRATPKRVFSIPCHLCSCRCGQPLTGFNGDINVKLQRRGASTASKAPSVRRNKPLILRHEYREATALYRHQLFDYLTGILTAHQVELTADKAIEFLDRVFNQPAARGKTIERFREVQNDLAIPDNHLWLLGKTFVVGPKEFRDQGLDILFIMSAGGHPYSTMWLMSEALLQFKRNPRVMHSKQLEAPRKQLTRLADENDFVEAKVLEGKIAYEVMGDEQRAREYWERAMQPSIKMAREVLDAVKSDAVQTSFDGLEIKFDASGYYLSSPWDELTIFHRSRENAMFERGDQNYVYERASVKKYVDIGCAMDDPTSYFRRADFFKSTQNGVTIYTSSWLYDMTKAASSLHVQAAHQLAEFYSTSVWRYIDDEPPDHLKPTAFDSQPVPFVALLKSGFWGVIKRLTGIGSGIHAVRDPSEIMFFTALFPSTALERLKLAKAWLEQPLKQLYAPSFLLAANLEREKWLYKDANTPQAALKLGPKRYGELTSSETADKVPVAGRENVVPAGCFANPTRNMEKAKGYIREVFNAVNGEKIRTGWLKKRYLSDSGMVRRVRDEDEYSENDLEMLPPDWTKWYRNATVYNMYRSRIQELLVEAKQMCDEEGWDIYDDEDALVYRYNRRNHAVYTSM